jgi:hypothetical protein
MRAVGQRAPGRQGSRVACVERMAWAAEHVEPAVQTAWPAEHVADAVPVIVPGRTA